MSPVCPFVWASLLSSDLLPLCANFYYCTPIIAPAMQMHRVPAMIEEFKKRGATLEVNIF
jgi:hypothetical protein